MTDTSGSTLQSLIEAALNDYETQTELKLMDHPLARQLENCSSVESITVAIQDQVQAFSEFRQVGGNVMKPLKRVVHVLYTTNAAVSGGISLPVSPVMVISAALGILLRAIKDVSASYDALVDLLESIEHFLSRLDIYVKFLPMAPTAAMKEVIVKIMVVLLSTIGLVTKQIKQKRPLKFIKKLLGEGEIEAVLQRLDRLTNDEVRTTAAQTLEVVYGLVQNMRVVMDGGKASADGIRDALEIMQDVASNINKSQREELLQNARKWLSPPDPWKNHDTAWESHHRGTSSWFIEGNPYKEWKFSDSNSLLWIHGKPGAGKSTLCSTIVEDIDHMRRSGLASLAFFYCDFRDDDKKNLRGLLTSLLVQFCHASDAYSAILSDLYSEYNNGSRHPSDNALIGCLKKILKHPGQAPVYIIIDGLDECPNTLGMPSPREKVLKFVEELVNLHLEDFHFCITSRPESDITISLDLLPFNQLSLHNESGQMQDIVKYVNFVVGADPKINRWRAEDKALVIKVLTKKSDGMFRWVFCQFEVLRRCLPARIRQVLEEIPESLDGTYERILQDIDKANWKFAHRLFQCLAVASRPLLVEELAEFLAFDFDAGPTPAFRVGWRPEDPVGAVLSTCSSLLAVVEVEGSAFVQFSHFSVKEFLTSNRLAETEDIISRYHVSLKPAHTIVAQACLGILLHLDEKITNDRLGNFPLAEYAATHWVDHARFENVSSNTQDGMKRLFDPNRPHLTVMVWIYDPEIPWWARSDHPSEPRGTCLHYAVLSGLPGLVTYVVTEFSPDVNAPRFFDEVTALHLASRDGHVEVARLLLEHGAGVNAKDASKWTPLRHALDKGHVEIAQVLLEHGADVNSRDEDNWMPLHSASRRGQAELAQVLLEHGVDATGRDKWKSTPLHSASRRGHVGLTRILLERGADATSRDKGKSTPLHSASQGGHVDLSRLLLEHGADATARDKWKSTPLHSASLGGYVDLTRLLLEHGADACAQDKWKLSPLHLASLGGHVNLTQVLLDHGADATVRDENESTPLHFASRGRNMDLVRILLKHKADANARDSPGGHAQRRADATPGTVNRSPPLYFASRERNMVLVRTLLEHKTDTNARDSPGGHVGITQHEHREDATVNGLTPLDFASRGINMDLVRILLEHKADANAQDKWGSTPLHSASLGGYVDLTRLLLDHSADATAGTVKGSTPLHFASRGGHVDLARVLLEHGADAIARDNMKLTPLHLASLGGHVDVTRMLLERGADANARDKLMLTPLHLASRGGHVDLTMMLLEHGADVTALDENGSTPWHLASRGRHMGVSRVLREHARTHISPFRRALVAILSVIWWLI